MVNAISIGSPIVIGFSVNKEMDAEGITITVPFSFRQPDIKNNMRAVINIKKTSLYFILCIPLELPSSFLEKLKDGFYVGLIG